MGFAFHQLCLLQWNSNPLLPLRLLGYGTPLSLSFLVTPYSICMVKIKKKKKRKRRLRQGMHPGVFTVELQWLEH